MRVLVSSLVVIAGAALSAAAQETGPKTRQPRGTAPTVKNIEPRSSDTGGFTCTATSIRVSNLRTSGPSPVALPALYAHPFVGTCDAAEKRAKAMPSRDTNYVILGRTTPIEMAAGLCQSGAGNRTLAKSDLKPVGGGFVKPATTGSKETITITRAMKYMLTGTGGGFSYTMTGACAPTQPAS